MKFTQYIPLPFVEKKDVKAETEDMKSSVKRNFKAVRDQTPGVKGAAVKTDTKSKVKMPPYRSKTTFDAVDSMFVQQCEINATTDTRGIFLSFSFSFRKNICKKCFYACTTVWIQPYRGYLSFFSLFLSLVLSLSFLIYSSLLSFIRRYLRPSLLCYRQLGLRNIVTYRAPYSNPNSLKPTFTNVHNFNQCLLSFRRSSGCV